MKIKAIFSLFLSVLFIFLSVSCSQDTEETFNTDFTADENGVYDFNGSDYILLQEYDDTIVCNYPQETALADAVLQRISDINAKYNCNLHIESGNDRYLKSYITRVFGGTYVGEIGMTHSPAFIARAGILYPLDCVADFIDITDSDKYGHYGLLEHGFIDSIPYTVEPNKWAGKQMTYTYNIFAVNEKMIKRYNLTDPRDYVENGEWTFDTFYDILPSYQINDGDTQITAANITWSFTLDIAFMNGFDFVTQLDDGSFASNMECQELVEALNWCSKLLVDRAEYISYLGHYDMISAFNNNKLIFANTSFSHMINEIIYDAEDYGVVPFPCGPSGEYGKWSGALSDHDSFCIFINAKEPEGSAFLISELLEPLDGYTTDEDLERYASTVFYDSRDVEFFLNNAKYLRYNYWDVGVYGYFSTAKEYCMQGKSGTEIVEKIGEQVNTVIDEYILPNYELITELRSK